MGWPLSCLAVFAALLAQSGAFVCNHTTIGDAAWSTFANRISGSVITQGSPTWPQEIAQFNNNSLPTPLGFVVPKTVQDVSAALSFARLTNHCISMKSSGHSYEGLAVLSHRVILDLTGFDHRLPGASNDTIELGPGVHLHQLVDFAESLGVYTPWGGCPTVALGGYLQGGGQGNANRLRGVGVDQVMAVTVITADGQLINASASNHSDLYWALRGGGGPGGNFGIVVSYTLKVYPAPPQILRFSTTSTKEFAREYATTFLSQAVDSPREFGAGISWNSDGTVTLSGWWLGNTTQGHQYLQNYPNVTATAMDLWAASRLDFQYWGTLPHSMKLRGHSSFFPNEAANSTEVLDALFQVQNSRPNKGHIASMGMYLLGGQVAEVAENSTAFVHRKFLGDFAMLCGWTEPADAQPLQQWVDKAYATLRPLLSQDVYQNAVDLSLSDWQAAYYGQNYARLVSVKDAYDPLNYFNFPQSLGS